MRRYFLIAAALLVAAVTACHRQVPVAVVREARLRTEANRSDRLTLPLDAACQTRLIDFLEKGGDNRHADRVDLEARDHYRPLLEALSRPERLSSDELTRKRTFQKWFPKPFTDQVVDARNAAPAQAEVAAVSDSRYWWIFYIRDGRLSELLVTPSIGYQPRR